MHVHLCALQTICTYVTTAVNANILKRPGAARSLLSICACWDALSLTTSTQSDVQHGLGLPIVHVSGLGIRCKSEKCLLWFHANPEHLCRAKTRTLSRKLVTSSAAPSPAWRVLMDTMAAGCHFQTGLIILIGSELRRPQRWKLAPSRIDLAHGSGFKSFCTKHKLRGI